MLMEAKLSENVGYGYNRSEKDFKPFGLDFVAVDSKATKRSFRGDVMQRIKTGDTLYIFSWKELAPGRLKPDFAKKLDAMGVSVVLLTSPEKPKVTPSGRGMSDLARKEAMKMWPDAFHTVETIQAKLEKEGHGTFTRNQLNTALGPRFKNR